MQLKFLEAQVIQVDGMDDKPFFRDMNANSMKIKFAVS